MFRVAFAALAALAAVPTSAAAASCRIRNETGHAFTVESGNTSNQSVGAHTTTSIAAGTIIARTRDGATVTGRCASGDEIRIVEERGALLITPAAAPSAPAGGSCRVANRTGHAFTVESGNTSNQSVGAHTTTSISAGTIIGRTRDGRTVSGRCSPGDELEIVEEKGALILEPQ